MTEITDFNFAEDDFTAADLAKFELIKSEKDEDLNELAELLNKIVAAKVAKLSQEKDEFYSNQLAVKELESDTFYNHSPSGYFSTDGNGIINKINDTLLVWLGYAKEDIIGKVTWQSLLSVGGKMYFETHYSPLLQMQGFVQEISFEMVKKDKTRLPILINTKQIRDENGKVQINYSTVFDISQRKSYEKELLIAKRTVEDENELIEYTFRNASIPIYYVLEDASIYDFNDIGAENLGYTSEELHTLKIYDLDKNYDEKKWASLWAKLKAEKKITIETQQQKKDGTLIDVIITANYVKYGDLQLNCSYVQDITEKKKVEQQLNLLDYSYKNTDSAMSFLDKNGLFVDFNQATANMLGYNYEEFRGKTIIDINPMVTKEFWVNRWEELKVTPNQKFEAKFKRKDGTFIDVAVSTNSIELNGKIVNFGIYEDITEKKKGAEDLKLMDFAFRKSATPIMLLLPTGEFYSFNDALLNLLGYTKEEFSKLNLFNVATTMDEASCISQWDEIREKRNIVFECHFERKDGTLLDVEVSSNLINYNEYELNFSYINDITEKKKAEAEIYSINELLQRQTNRLLLATKSAELGIWDWDLENDSIIWDEGMCKLYGIAANEFKTINEEWIGRLHEEDRTEIENEIQLAIRNKKDYNTEFRIKWSDSSIHCIKATGIVERVNGKPKRMIGVNWDVTKEIEAVIEKERMIAELLENNLELKQFGFITTHNLRAPLTNLVMICNLINLEVIEDPSTLKLIEIFKTCTYQLNETLNDLINVLIIKENIDLKLDKLSFEEIIDNVKESIYETLNDSKVMIEADFSDAPTVHFTKVYLESIFLNLITNSIKYQHPQRNPIIKIKTIKDSIGRTKLTFSDNGLGIDMSRVKHKIFGFYQRFHKNADSKGIGLFLIKSQLNALGGQIEVDSEVNIGTTFTITFK